MVAGRNVLRVLREAERVGSRLRARALLDGKCCLAGRPQRRSRRQSAAGEPHAVNFDALPPPALIEAKIVEEKARNTKQL